MAEKPKKVLILHYPEPDGTKTLLRGVCKREYPITQEMQMNGLLIGKPKQKEFLHGKVVMLYTTVSNVPNVKVNGVIYFGAVVFMARDENGVPCDLTEKLIRAIKCVTKKL